MDHAATYQGDDSIKIRELWVPAAAILEDGLDDLCPRHPSRGAPPLEERLRHSRLLAARETQGMAGEKRARWNPARNLVTDAGPVCFRLLNRWTGARAN